MMLKKLTMTTPKIGTSPVIKTVMRSAFLGLLCIFMISCAQPDQKKQASKGREGGTSQGNQGQSSSNNQNQRATSNTPGAQTQTQAGFRDINDANVPEDVKKAAENSIVQISYDFETDAHSTTTAKFSGFISEEKAISTTLSKLMPTLIKKLGNIEDLKSRDATEIETKVKEIELSEGDLLIRNAKGDRLNTGMTLTLAESTAKRVATKIKSSTSTAITFSIVEDSARLISDRAISGSVIVKADGALDFCVRASAPAAQNPQPASGRAGTQQRSSNTTPNPSTASTQRTLSIAGFANTTELKVELSSGPLVELKAALQSVNVQDAITNSSSLQCGALALAADATESLIGSPIFENGKVVGMVVKQAGNGTSKRTFGLAIDKVD